MKKIIALILAIVICLSLCACGGKNSEIQEELPILEENPILGKWTSKTAQTEATFEFAEIADELVGTWSCYDYEEGKWGEFDFTVKEQTNFTITLLVEDGTLDTMTCWMAGDSLYVDGACYINSEKNVALSEYISNYNVVIDGKYMQVYGNILLGMSFDEVEIALSDKLTDVEKNEVYDPAHYDPENPYDFYTYAYTAKYEANDTYLTLWFDGQMNLIYFRYTEWYNEDRFVDEFISNAELKFGEYGFSKADDEHYYKDVYSWRNGNVDVKLTYTQNIENKDSNWVEVSYHYKPQN